MKNDKKSLDVRIAQYNKHYGYLENPKKFTIEYDPHRLIIRNFALRNKRRELYEDFIRSFYPDKVEKELGEFDSCLMYLKFFNKEEARDWFNYNDVKLLESDIQCFDNDAILRMLFVEDQSDLEELLSPEQSFILNRTTPELVLKNREQFWIDTRIS
ncbi:hypothetical protein LZQ00_05550 [Sphingobacterium sp. SRCM116780]|uniref:hypothetical protein n=1 Tax=Sphingobacterium sp. SRCM116780 TaxID=2907623 RepID=UPI001F40D5E2|nr:hypothetical protein [Sphingobacterium sp. SRCM116780]UIR57279.1 hypothetical protein LZQ00_05550 [Sphingobacterium sp. SRCM116780]